MDTREDDRSKNFGNEIFDNPTFSPHTEKDVTRAIVEEYTRTLLEYIESDVIIVGAGPSGLVCARDLALKGKKVLIVEANNYLGGGFWIGGYLMNTLTFREPAQKVLDELEIPYREHSTGLYVADGPTACSKLIFSACQAGAKVFNMTKFDDVVLRNEREVSGIVMNWTPVGALPRAITCVDPVAIESKIVVDATGHDAVVLQAMEKRGLLKTVGFGAMDVVGSEGAVVVNTTEISPGLVVCGMAVSTAFGLPRMGPTFGSMLLSGKKAADVCIRILKEMDGDMKEGRSFQEHRIASQA